MRWIKWKQFNNAADCYEATVFIVYCFVCHSEIWSIRRAAEQLAQNWCKLLFICIVRLSTSEKWMQQSVESWNCARLTALTSQLVLTISQRPIQLDDYANENPEWPRISMGKICGYRSQWIWSSGNSPLYAQTRTMSNAKGKKEKKITNTIVFTALVFFYRTMGNCCRAFLSWSSLNRGKNSREKSLLVARTLKHTHWFCPAFEYWTAVIVNIFPSIHLGAFFQWCAPPLATYTSSRKRNTRTQQHFALGVLAATAATVAESPASNS